MRTDGTPSGQGKPPAERPDARPPIWVGHIRLTCGDVERSSNFYEKLGFRPVAVMTGIAVMELRGGTHIVLAADPDAGAQPAAFDLMVEDLDAAREDWSSMGVTVSDIEKGPIHRAFIVRDPDGNSITVNDSHVVGVV